MARIQLRRGLESALPSASMLAGEPHWTSDRGTIQVASDATTLVPLVPQIEDLTAIGTVATDDLLMMHDTSETTGQFEKKITFTAFKTALNIPASSTDEKVAVVSGGTADYIWGTDGSDGIFRMGTSMSWTKDAGDAYVTLEVATVDGGTF